MISNDKLSYRNRRRDRLVKLKLDFYSISNFWFYPLCERHSQTFVIYHKNLFLNSVFNFLDI